MRGTGLVQRALLPLAGHGGDSACALGCEGNETSLPPALGATPGSGAEAVSGLCRAQPSPLQQ